MESEPVFTGYLFGSLWQCAVFAPIHPNSVATGTQFVIFKIMQMKELLLVSRRLNPHRVTSIGDGDLTDFYLHALHLKVFTFIFIELKLNIFLML